MLRHAQLRAHPDGLGIIEKVIDGRIGAVGPFRAVADVADRLAEHGHGERDPAGAAGVAAPPRHERVEELFGRLGGVDGGNERVRVGHQHVTHVLHLAHAARDRRLDKGPRAQRQESAEVAADPVAEERAQLGEATGPVVGHGHADVMGRDQGHLTARVAAHAGQLGDAHVGARGDSAIGPFPRHPHGGEARSRRGVHRRRPGQDGARLESACRRG